MSKNDETIDVFCQECNIQVEAKIICSGSGGFSSDAINPIDEVDSEYHGDVYVVALCRRCNAPFLIKKSLYGIPAEFETVTDEIILYPNVSRLPAKGIPDPVYRAYEQALKCFSASSYEASALMCRRCLEALCKFNSAHGGTLHARLDSLSKSGLIDKRLAEWAHGIRAIGNEAAHDTDTELTKDDARDALDFTEALLLYIFALNARFSAFQKRRRKNKGGETQQGA